MGNLRLSDGVLGNAKGNMPSAIFKIMYDFL